ncbi:hypothetical protein LIER_00245 [Lithospermum erythrorhizon]|uniref:Uncharacterized protein n=1 Tax=Lithospermum erythrorhizon TaxID=34254 RepID=A0AAV3NHY9_LITER
MLMGLSVTKPKLNVDGTTKRHFVECWTYEYFPMYARVPSASWVPGTERVLRWKDNNRHRNENSIELVVIHKQLDNTTAEHENSYKKVYGHADEYEQMAQHTYAFRDLGDEARITGQTIPDYTDWLQPLRQELFLLSQQASQDLNVPNYVRTSLDNISRYAGTGGFPGVHQTPMQNWWGPHDRYPEEQYRHPIDLPRIP